MPRKLALIAPAALAAAVLVAGCGGGSSSGSSSGATTSSSAASSGTRTVSARDTSLGKILVSGGRTLYLFVKDTGTKSTCNGACAAGWPPLLTSGSPKAGAGVDPSMLGTTTRSDGKTEVTYAGHPLYFFVEDSSPGQMKGQAVNAFGALWWVVSPGGKAITAKATGGTNTTTTNTTTTTSGGYGY
jgi:predicted lipoprotein with Yx(FWY)xxD motif